MLSSLYHLTNTELVLGQLKPEGQRTVVSPCPGERRLVSARSTRGSRGIERAGDDKERPAISRSSLPEFECTLCDPARLQLLQWGGIFASTQRAERESVLMTEY
jgi:hypothetical protein